MVNEGVEVMNLFFKQKSEQTNEFIESEKNISLSNELELYKDALKEIKNIAEAVSKGDLSKRIVNWDQNKETSATFIAINSSYDIIDAFVRESAATLKSAAQGEFHRKFIERGMPGDFKRGANIINEAQSHMQNAESSRKEEMINLADELEREVKTAVEFVEERGKIMSAKSTEMSENLEEVSQKASKVVELSDNSTHNVETCAVAVEEMSVSAQEIQRQIENSRDSMSKSEDEIQKTREIVTELSSAAEEIGDIANMIKDIASRTNLLALNATIEAARAGDFGKGFAVVASEVKNLATQTGEATEQVDRQITTIQEMAKETSSAVKKIGDVIYEAGEISVAVAAAAKEQLVATTEISENVQQAAQSTKSASTSVTEMAGKTAGSTESAKAVTEEVKEVHHATQDLSGRVNIIMSNLRNYSAFNRRSAERFYDVAKSDCTIELNGQIHKGVIDNISTSGAAIRVNRSYNVGDEITFIAQSAQRKILSTVIEYEDNIVRIEFNNQYKDIIENTEAS